MMDACSEASETFSLDHSVSSPDTTNRGMDVTQPLRVDCTDEDDTIDMDMDAHMQTLLPDGHGGGTLTSHHNYRPTGGGGGGGPISRRDRKKSKMSPTSREELRLKINHRERERMHDLNSSMDALRQVMPYAHGPSVKKLSKMATLLLARNYIILLTRSMEEMRRLLAEAYRSNPLVGPPPGGLPAHHLPGYRPGLDKLLAGVLPPGLGVAPPVPPPAAPAGPLPPSPLTAAPPPTSAFHLEQLMAARLPPSLHPHPTRTHTPPEVKAQSPTTSTSSLPPLPPISSSTKSAGASTQHVIHHPTPTLANRKSGTTLTAAASLTHSVSSPPSPAPSISTSTSAPNLSGSALTVGRSRASSMADVVAPPPPLHQSLPSTGLTAHQNHHLPSPPPLHPPPLPTTHRPLPSHLVAPPLSLPHHHALLPPHPLAAATHHHPHHPLGGVAGAWAVGAGHHHQPGGAPCSCVYCHLAVHKSTSHESLLKQA